MESSKGPVISGLRPKRKKDDMVENKPMCSNPLERLCELLLDWNFYSNCCLAATTKTKDMPIKPFHHVPNVFHAYGEYIDIWEPLVLEEIRANVLNNFAARLNKCKSREFQFSLSENKLKQSSLMTIESQFLPSTKSNSNDYQNDNGPLSMDLVLFSPIPFNGSIFEPTPESKDTSSNGTSKPIEKKAPQLMLGLIVGTTLGSKGARTYQIRCISSIWETFKNSVQMTIRNNNSANSQANAVSNTNINNITFPSSSGPVKTQNKNGYLTYNMHYCILENIRSNWREFLAIHELGCNIPLLKEILGGFREMEMIQTPPLVIDEAFADSVTSDAIVTSNQPNSHATLPRSQARRMPIEQEVETWRMDGVTDKFMKYLRSKFNNSQLYAIKTSTAQMGFTLIQGPPGTGKTSTIIGILNAIHIREYNKHYEEALYTVLGPVGLNCRNSNSETNWLQLVSKLAKKKPHILVVAPSNVAVDNIIERIMEDGFIDGNGGKYFPNMLRVGAGRAPRVQSVTLEDTMKQEEIAVSKSMDKMSHLVGLNVQITQLIQDIIKCQSLLFDLKIAFDAHYPLPEGWELRMSTKTGFPYWVDHNLKRTSTTPPIIVKPQPGHPPVVRTRYSRIEFLPEFIVHSHHLTQLIEQLDICNMKRTRLQTLMQNLSNGGRFDDGNSTNGSSTTLHGKELLESSIIDSAQLLFTTLNSSGHPSMEATEFCVTVIDEAAQCVEPSVLIALRRGCKQCIMVGDQQQLPATTFSTSAKAAGYEKSLFERLVDSGQPYIMLDTQYRMAPTISAFPSNMFYYNNLRDGANVCADNYGPSYLDVRRDPNALFKPFLMFDLASSKETDGNATSKANQQESFFIVNIIWALIDEANRAGKTLGSVGVITPYNEQLDAIRKLLSREGLLRANPPNNNNNNRSNNNNNNSSNSNQNVPDTGSRYDIECNTVDGFQGREKDIIIISTVRANDQKQIGFVSDIRRMNVGLTRAKYGLYVVGHAPTLSSNAYWKDLLDYARRWRSLVQVPDSNTVLKRLLAGFNAQIGNVRMDINSNFLNSMRNYQNNSERWESSMGRNTSSASLHSNHSNNSHNSNDRREDEQDSKRARVIV